MEARLRDMHDRGGSQIAEAGESRRGGRQRSRGQSRSVAQVGNLEQFGIGKGGKKGLGGDLSSEGGRHEDKGDWKARRGPG